MKSMIVAYGRNREIGADNDLLWHLPAELRHFKQLTVGTSIVMGRRTFESIGRPLPDRQNIVVTHRTLDAPGIQVASSLGVAYELALHDIMIIGGESVYREALPDVDTIYATEVDAEFPQATVFFPSIDTTKWREISRQRHEADDKNIYTFEFVTYERI